jgi:cytochrome bd-type quinol oxidase subunit 2
MKPLVKHVAIPALAPVALIALYFTPKEVFGCANRGFMALGVVFLAAIAAFVTISKGAAAQRRGSKESVWWLVSTLILISAIVLLLGPLR